MHAISLVMLAVLGASERSPSLSTTLPGGTWEVSGALGPKDIGSVAGPGFGWDAEAAVGITDQVQLDIFAPAVVLRVGNAGDSEYLFGAGTWGVESSVRFAAITYELGASLGMRNWYGKAVAVSFTLDASNTRPWGIATLTPFFTLTAGAGVTLALGDAVSVHLALAATNTTDVLANFYQTAPRLGLGSVQRLGFRRLPLVQVRVLPMLSADLFADAWADFPYQGPIAFDALAGATFEFPW
ncbi:MAG TPA: hypothetical protein VFA20_20115 [Myxococcaceae bacterium]|nr:hypothetical protein [Myxococcaceae bacterium]